MTDRSVSVVLRAIVGPYQAAMQRAAAVTAGLNTQVGRLQASTGRVTGGLGRMAGGLTQASGSTRNLISDVTGLSPKLLGVAGLAYGLKQVASTAISWESAFAGVRKTVNGTEQELADLSTGLRKMSTEIPTSANDLAAIAESAGQLGIETQNVLEFTEVIAGLGETTNLAGQQGATQLARFANITGMAQEDFDRLASTIVDLGNNLATTEAEISDMALRLAGAGTQVGMSEAQILALAGSLSEVGIEAEAGGSAFSRVMIEIENSVSSADERLATFARVSGMSASEFAAAWQQDATGALVAFVSGLGRMSDAGENVFPILDELELGEIRVRDALLRTSQASENLTENIELGTEAWQANVAAQEELDKRLDTTRSKLGLAGNEIAELARKVGRPLGEITGLAAEATSGVVGFVNDYIDAMNDPSMDTPEVQDHVAAVRDMINQRDFSHLGPTAPQSAPTNMFADVDPDAARALRDVLVDLGSRGMSWVSSTGADFLDWLSGAEEGQTELEDATRDAMLALQDQANELKAQTDPLFGAVNATMDYHESLADVKQAEEDLAQARAHLNDANEDTRTTTEDVAEAQDALVEAERRAYQSAFEAAYALANLTDENGDLVYSTEDVIRMLSRMGVPPEVVQRLLSDIRTVRGELDGLADTDPTVIVTVKVNRTELDRLNAEFGNVATGGGMGQGGRTVGTGTVEQNIAPAYGGDWKDNIPVNHAGGRVTGGLGWMPGLDPDERLRVLKLGETITPAYASAQGMGGGSSTSVGRQVQVAAGAIQLVVADPDAGMRAAADKLDLMADGFI